MLTLVEMRCQVLWVLLVLCVDGNWCASQRLGHQLFTMDRNISQLMRWPHEDKGGQLLRHMVCYLRLLCTLVTRVSLHLDHARRAARYLFKHEGPKFLRIKYSEESMVQVFDWSSVELKHFRFLKSETVSEYELFTKCYRANLVWFL